MSWVMITALESPSVDRPFEVTEPARRQLLANGWRAPRRPPLIHHGRKALKSKTNQKGLQNDRRR